MNGGGPGPYKVGPHRIFGGEWKSSEKRALKTDYDYLPRAGEVEVVTVFYKPGPDHEPWLVCVDHWDTQGMISNWWEPVDE